MTNRWWIQPFGLPPSDSKGLPDITDRQVLVARAGLLVIPSLAVVAALVLDRWYLLIFGASPLFNLFVVAPRSHRRRVLGRDR